MINGLRHITAHFSELAPLYAYNRHENNFHHIHDDPQRYDQLMHSWFNLDDIP